MIATSLRLASRGSALALAQTELAAAALRAAGAASTEIVVVRTRGDAAPAGAGALEGQGWFTGELEEALRDGRADCAVHSAKDLPTAGAEGLVVAAHLRRGDPRDALVLPAGLAASGGALDATLAAHSVHRVGTTSARRAAFLREAARRCGTPVEAVPVRGNVDTRLRKLDAGEVDALVVAAAGLDRIGRADRASLRLAPRECVPAPAQGAVAIQACAAAPPAALAARCDDGATTAAVTAERAVLRELGGGCLLPLGAWARLVEGELVLVAALEVDGEMRFCERAGSPADPLGLGAAVAAGLRG